MINDKKLSKALFLSIATLVLFGILILASVSAVFSIERFGKSSYLFEHQFLRGFLLGLFGAIIAFFMPLEKIKKLGPWFFVVCLVLLGILAFSKIGLKVFGATSWLKLGALSFQPSEFLKPAFIVYLAAWLAKDEFSKKKLLPFLLILGLIAVLLIIQPDVGTLGVIALIAAAMFFIAKTPLWQNFFLWGLGIGSFMALVKLAPYRFDRWLVFLNPGLDPMGKSYQISQSMIAIGSGGATGLGLGLSRQKFGFLPQTIGDAIFPVFAEEAGFVGTFILIAVFIFFLWCGFSVCAKAKDKFSQIAGSGICIWIGLQALINIGSMTGLLPLTGVPLPLISYGGSHLAAELVGLGILMNIAKNN